MKSYGAFRPRINNIISIHEKVLGNVPDVELHRSGILPETQIRNLGPRQAVLGNGFRPLLFRLVQGDPKNLKALVMVIRIDIFQDGIEFAARSAPASPEIQESNLVLVRNYTYPPASNQW